MKFLNSMSLKKTKEKKPITLRMHKACIIKKGLAKQEFIIEGC